LLHSFALMILIHQVLKDAYQKYYFITDFCFADLDGSVRAKQIR
jgi:hypothetical protein